MLLFFVPVLASKIDQPGYLPPQIYNESHFNVYLCPVSYLKAYLCYTEPLWKKLDGSCVSSLFLGNNRQHTPVCAKMISTWVRKVLYIVKAHMCLCAVHCDAALAASLSLVSMLHAGD